MLIYGRTAPDIAKLKIKKRNGKKGNYSRFSRRREKLTIRLSVIGCEIGIV
jgi:hypothetical protein